MIEYTVGMSGQVVVFVDTVVEHLRRCRQLGWCRREAGGQLFARFSERCIRVEEATGPRRTDRRTRTSYEPDRRAELQEIAARYPHGLHYVGDWHTHPERYPCPSPADTASITDCFRKSSHDLNAFLLVIVGTAELPECLCVSAHSASSSLMLARRDATVEAGTTFLSQEAPWSRRFVGGSRRTRPDRG